MSHELEEGNKLRLDFGKLSKIAKTGREVVPVVVQHADTKEVLILAYADKEALDYSLSHRQAAFYSTSRGELWIKGSSSGDFLELCEVRVNCEQNSLLYLVRPATGGVCHTKNEDGTSRKSCYYRRLSSKDSLSFVSETA